MKTGIFSRLSDLLKSNIDDLLNGAEYPEKMIDQIISDMRNQLCEAIEDFGKSKSDECLAEMKLAEAETVSAEWEGNAKAALENGDVELARQAAARKIRADEDVDSYRMLYDSVSKRNNALHGQIERLKAKIDEAERHKALMTSLDKTSEDNAEKHDIMNENIVPDEQALIDAEIERLLAEMSRKSFN